MPMTPLSENWIFEPKQSRSKHSKSLLGCIFYSCRFLSLRLPASSENISEILKGHFREKSSLKPHDIIIRFRDQIDAYRKVPYMIDKLSLDYFGLKPEQSDNESFFVEEDKSAYTRFLHLIKSIPEINGAIIAGSNLVAIAMRKLEDGTWEFFDPHGANELTEHNMEAYIKKCATLEEAVQFLSSRFAPEPEGGELVSPATVWAISYHQ